MKPMLIVVTGQSGAGKTTLSERLSREWYLPLVSRDRVKEGYVHSLNVGHDALADDSNLVATNAFFDIVKFMLDRGISCIAEAAFQHKLWAARLPALADVANVHMIVCRVKESDALDRFLRRGLENPMRLRFHDDPGVRMAMQGGKPKIGVYAEPQLSIPTYPVDTTDGYQPSINELQRMIFSQGTME